MAWTVQLDKLVSFHHSQSVVVVVFTLAINFHSSQYCFIVFRCQQNAMPYIYISKGRVCMLSRPRLKSKSKFGMTTSLLVPALFHFFHT